MSGYGFMIPFLAVAAALLVILLYKFRRKGNKILLTLEAMNIKAIGEKFGFELIPKTWIPNPEDEHKTWYTSLRKDNFHQWPTEQEPSYSVKSDLIIRNQAGHYWHLLVTSSYSSGWKNAVYSQGNVILTSLNEKRVKQVLFSHPELYLAAFGKKPDKQDLK